MLQAIIAAVITAVGVALLFLSWDGRIDARFKPVLGGWLLLIGSLFFWSRASGVEVGVTLAVMVPAFVAWPFAIRRLEVRSPARPKRKRTGGAPEQQETSLAMYSWPRHLLLFVLTVPLCAVAAAFASVAFAKLMPLAQLSEMVLAIIIMPVLWGAAAYWVVADSKWLRPTAATLLVGTIAATALFI